MSPLRYQKWLRLNEVRRPMLNEHYDVTTAAYAVGYESYPISVGNIRGCLESHPREILIETGCVWHGYAHPSNLPIFISFLMRNGLYLERYEKSHNI